MCCINRSFTCGNISTIKYDIIQMPQKKTLGLFGGKDAEVRVYYEIPDAGDEAKAPSKPEKKAKTAQANAKETKAAEKAKPAPAAAAPEAKAAGAEKNAQAKSEKSAPAKQQPAKQPPGAGPNGCTLLSR